MADTIVEGSVLFRDGRKWKSRWCVVRKLSPAADCVQMALYAGGPRARPKAALALWGCVGWQAGFTLDAQSHTLALVCAHVVPVLALESRERLLQWQARLAPHVAPTRAHLVLLQAAPRARPGPARLLLHCRRAALVTGVPPRLLGLWDLAHLRRYGVVEGRFCFEGGSQCGKGEGLHVLVTDRAHEINRDFDLALQGILSPGGRSYDIKESEESRSLTPNRAFRPDTRLSELHTNVRASPPSDLQQGEGPGVGHESGAISPCWGAPRSHRPAEAGPEDTASVREGMVGGAEWGAGGAALSRCRSCMSALGARSCWTPHTPHFSPAWTMEPLHEACPEPGHRPHGDGIDVCRCPELSTRGSDRPPKPTRLDLYLNNPVPCGCGHTGPADDCVDRTGPYDNYDVPKLPSSEVDGQYYATPKRLKECLNNELFKITKSSTSNSLILKKSCGCLLSIDKRRKEPTIIDAEENIQPENCACRRVTDWANNWIKLPYCRKNSPVSGDNLVPNKENVIPNSNDSNAIYAMIDLSQKTKRKGLESHDEVHLEPSVWNEHTGGVDIDDGPLANYENLSFALSLEHYENAKDLLRQAGVTQTELDAISTNLRPTSLATNVINKNSEKCSRCGHRQRRALHHLETLNVSTNDDYLMMEPNVMENKTDLTKPPPQSGYTPMSPIGGFSLKTQNYPAKGPINNKLLDEKSASNPSLCVLEPNIGVDKSETEEPIGPPRNSYMRNDRIVYRQRSSSADSSRLLDDVKEFEVSAGSTSSIETLRHIALEERTAPCAYRQTRAAPAASATAPGNRDSSSSNDSGVSSCSQRRTSRNCCAHAPRRCKSTDPLRDVTSQEREGVTAKSSSAGAEVPVLTAKPLGRAAGMTDTRSTSSGASDLSDYIETLSICSSHSSSDVPLSMRVVRPATSTLRPRSGGEYLSVEPRLRAHSRPN